MASSKTTAEIVEEEAKEVEENTEQEQEVEQKQENKENKNKESTLEERYHVDQTYDKKKFDKMKYAEAVKYVEELDNLNVLFVTKTKAVLILGLAEKLEKQKYPLLEIKAKITEDLKAATSISDVYISRCLPDRFKNPARLKAGKENVEKRKAHQEKNKNKNNSHEAEMFDTDEDEDKDYNDSISGNNNNNIDSPSSLPDLEQVAVPQGYTLEYIKNMEKENDILQQQIQTLKKQNEALQGVIPFSEMLEITRIHKLSKTQALKIEEVIKKSKADIVITTDIRSRQVLAIQSDKEYDKQHPFLKSK